MHRALQILEAYEANEHAYLLRRHLNDPERVEALLTENPKALSTGCHWRSGVAGARVAQADYDGRWEA